MGHTDGNTTADIRAVHEKLHVEASSYNFYQLVEILLRMENAEVESQEWERSCRLIFSGVSSLGFAASDVRAIETIDSERQKIRTSFLGLSGAQSPLPGYMIESLPTKGEGCTQQALFDFFNNRLINLLFRIWRKYRYHIRFLPDAQDAFSTQLFSLVGLRDPVMRGETPINWCKMLAYAGSLAGRSRSPKEVAGIIAHCFDLSHVQIRQWERRRVRIDDSQRAILGKRSVQLGKNCVIGTSVVDRSSRFVISISQLSRARFDDFLPPGKEFQPLRRLMELILRDQMAYDLELSLAEKEISDNREAEMKLGWTSFLGNNVKNRSVLIQVRQ